MASYTYGNEWQQARRRLACLEDVYDPGTIRHLQERGIGEGWTCLEVGAGGGTIASWLCRRVGADGRVLATDLDTRFLDVLELPNLEVRRHDILTDDLPAGCFDLVHTRAVLCHLHDHERGLARLVAAVKPGGWVLVEEPDGAPYPADPGAAAAAALFTKVAEARLRLMAMRGHDRHYGRRIYGQLHAHGMVEVAGEGRVPIAHGGSPMAEFFHLSTQQVREQLVTSGDVTDQEIKACGALLDDPAFTFMGLTMMAAWGRKPPR